ncbi:peptidase domain-containing ABC transporter [Ottowia sp.]|uniref:peptidase domain-containing ABC transporter n=1 Tax=Ottowia sp. TaxID=1898956 RepID=UPI0025CD5A87|nr:peptidase domain-containing ABC transporter [Ottowia sp.]MBK6616094.1 peptidase domain-containing ABC transporter [Ottowia sp.]
MNPFKKVMRPVLQAETSECGLACLAMLSTWHGGSVSLRELRRRFPVGGPSMSMKRLSDAASDLEFATRGVRIELDELALLQLPCILHWGMSHYVVLTHVTRSASGSIKKLTIVDPGRGELAVNRDEASARFTGVALEVQPTTKFERRKTAEPRASIRSMLKGINDLWRALAYVFVLAIAIEVFSLASPLFLQWVVDTALVSGDLDLLFALAAGFGLMVVLQALIGFMRSRIVLHASTRINIHWSASVFAHLVRLPLEYFHKRQLGEIVSRFGSIATIQHVLSHTFVESIIDGVMAAVTLIALVLYSPSLAAVVCCAVAIYAAIRASVYSRMRNTTAEMLSAQALEQTLLLETAQSMQAIKLFGKESNRQIRWTEAMVEAKLKDAQVQSTAIGVGVAYQMLFGLENVLIIVLAGIAVVHQEFTVGMIYAFLSYKGTFTSRSHSLIDKFMEFRMLSVHLERLADIVLEEREMASNGAARGHSVPPEDLAAPEFRSIEFRSVWFRYSDVSPWVLEDLNFSIQAGESIGLIGPSGRGKTTVLRLLLGTLKPTRGEVLINGVPMEAFGVERYRRMFASVMQDDHLLSGSVEENISFFDSDVDEERLVNAAKVAAIHDDIVRMPMGYGTTVGDLGCTLSAGQQQRVLLARAVYHSPTVLVLDEATSHLDVQTDAKVTAAIATLKITKVVVSHRPETISGVSRIVQLDRSEPAAHVAAIA